MNKFGLTDIVYSAYERMAQCLLLRRCSVSTFCLENWASISKITVTSNQVSGTSRIGLKRLRDAVKNGYLIEEPKDYNGQMIRFSLANKNHEDILLNRAEAYWRSFGYEVGVISDRKHP